MTQENALEEKLPTQAIEGDRRRSPRISLQVPLFVRGRDAQDETFLELAKTIDISNIGALVVCPRAPKVGELVTLTVPAPAITSSAFFSAGTPPIQAKVRRRQEAGDVHLIGVEFLKPIS